MFCKKCGNELVNKVKFCNKCGAKVEVNQLLAESPNKKIEMETNSVSEDLSLGDKDEPIIKCGSCGNISHAESARNIFFTILAILCIFGAPLITLLYFFGTNKYRCPKCKSTFLGVKNKEGVFVGQKGMSRGWSIFLFTILGIAIVAVLSAIVLVNVTSYVNKAKEASGQQTENWQIYNSVADQFSINIPSYPTLDSENNISAETGDANDTYSWHSYTSEKDAVIFYIYKYIYSYQIDTSNKDKLLETYLNQAVNADSNNQLISSNYIYYSSYRALDFLIKNNDVYLRGRIIESGQTPYLLMMEYSSSNYIATDYQKFVNSFEIK